MNQFLSSAYNPLPELPPEPEQGAGPAAPAAVVARKAPAEDPVWSGWDVVRIALMAFFAFFVFWFVAVWLALSNPALRRASPTDVTKDPLVSVSAQLMAYIVMVGFMYLLVTREHSRPFGDAVRWNWPHRTWFAFAALGFALAVAAQLLFILLPTLLPVPPQLPIDRFFTTPVDAYVMTAFGTLVAPVVEELFFRGFLYPILARRLGLLAGILLTAAAFAFIHASQLDHAWAPLLVLFLVGLVLTVTRAATRSVAASLLVHVCYNAALSAMMYVATGRFQHLERLRQ